MKKFFNRLKSITSSERSGLSFVITIATVASIWSFLYYYDHGLTLAYGDSKAHLTLARRVVSSLTPGVTQLGGIWLPLPHLLNLLTVWNDFMFYSGLSGSIVSMSSFVVSAILMYKSIYLYSRNVLGAIFGALILIFNPTFLYLQSTPMTEPLSLVFLLLTIFLLIKWSKSGSLGYLILAAFATALSTLTRYDNWFLLPCATIVIVLVEVLKKKNKRSIEGDLLMYLTLASVGILIWALYSLLIFGNILNFSNGQGSAAWYATSQHSLSKHNLLLSVSTYMWTSIDTLGMVSAVITTLCIAFFIIKKKVQPESIPVLLFLSPIVFNIVSLFLGQSIVFTQHLAPHTLYNSRYGINALPAVAFFIGFFAFGRKRLLAAILLVLVTTQYLSLFDNSITVLDEVNYGRNVVNKNATQWVKENPVTGNTLLSDLSLASLIGFDGKIPQDKLISEANGIYWKTSLIHPEKYAVRVIMSKQFDGNDMVWNTLHDSPKLNDYYIEVFNKDDVIIYDLKNFSTNKNLNKKTSLVTKKSFPKPSPISQKLCEYTVATGDTLWKIAKNKLGSGKDYKKIMDLNTTVDINRSTIHPSQKLNVPCV